MLFPKFEIGHVYLARNAPNKAVFVFPMAPWYYSVLQVTISNSPSDHYNPEPVQYIDYPFDPPYGLERLRPFFDVSDSVLSVDGSATLRYHYTPEEIATMVLKTTSSVHTWELGVDGTGKF